MLVGSLAGHVSSFFLSSSIVDSSSGMMAQSCFDIYFQRLSTEAAVILPSSPVTVNGLRSTTALQKWWSEAKRHAFRTWHYLINSPSGMFLVTKTIKTQRYAH